MSSAPTSRQSQAPRPPAGTRGIVHRPASIKRPRTSAVPAVARAASTVSLAPTAVVPARLSRSSATRSGGQYSVEKKSTIRGKNRHRRDSLYACLIRPTPQSIGRLGPGWQEFTGQGETIRRSLGCDRSRISRPKSSRGSRPSACAARSPKQPVPTALGRAQRSPPALLLLQRLP